MDSFKAAAHAAWSWAVAHPEICIALVGAVVTWFGKPRSPEEFAKMPHWKASLFKLCGAIFPDAAKAQQAVAALLKGKPLEATFMVKKPGSGLVFPAASALLALPIVFVLACGPSQPVAQSPERSIARASLALLAEGQKEADHVCAQYAQSKLDAKLAKSCADAYDVGRASLLAGQSLIDGWDVASQKQVLCAAGRGVEALKHVADAVSSAGGPAMPPVVQDALDLGSKLAVGCSDGGAQ